MGLLFKNNAETTLSRAINNSTTTIPVASAAVFPTPNANNKFFATLDDGSNVEVVLVTAISSNDLTVVRAQDNTSAAAFGSGTKIELRLTAKVLETGTTSLSDLDGDTAIFVEQVDDEDNIRFDTSGLQRFLIDSTGDIAVGSRGTNPLALGITGTVFTITEASNVASLQIDGVTGTRIDMGTSGNRNAVFFTDANNLEISRTTDHPIIFKVNSSEVLRFTSSGMQLAAGKNISNASGNLTLDAVGNLNLDADGDHIVFAFGGDGEVGRVSNESENLVFYALKSDKDISFNGNDGGTTITALTLDMSSKGRATFNEYVVLGEADDARLYFNASSGFSPRIQSATNDLTLYTNNSERLRLKNDGKLGLGTSTPATDGYSYAQDLVIMAGASASDGAGISINSASRQYGVIAFGDSAATNSGEIFYDHTGNALYFKTSAVSRWSLDSGGNMIATGNVTAYGTPSDIKLKEDINIIENAVDKVKQLQGITYTLKSDGNRLTGLIAQDLEKVLPEAVYTTKTIADEREGEESEEHLAIRYGNTVGLLVEAIKELEARVKELEAK